MPLRILIEIVEAPEGVNYAAQGHGYGPGATANEIALAERVKACLHAYDDETRSPNQTSSRWERSRPLDHE